MTLPTFQAKFAASHQLPLGRYWPRWDTRSAAPWLSSGLPGQVRYELVKPVGAVETAARRKVPRMFISGQHALQQGRGRGGEGAGGGGGGVEGVRVRQLAPVLVLLRLSGLR
jgi:hypothetical protein